MAIYSVFGALVGGLSKWHQLDPWAGRSRLTYYELVESRRRMMSPAFREEAKDGYFHQYLDPKLRDMGIKVPDSWQQQQQQ